MQELSLNVLDIVQNSISAKASLIFISVEESTEHHKLVITIADNGCGMTREQTERVTDPFYTTRTTRKIGMGVPLFKMMSEMTGGCFSIESEVGKGTTVRAEFNTESVDCLPLGDMETTVFALITMNCSVDFVYTDRLDGREFVLDTREFRKVLDGVPFDNPDVSAFIREFLTENSIRKYNT